jgi:hypothetical protein
MTAAKITYTGGEGRGDAPYTWGLPSSGTVEFPLNKAVTLDLDADDGKRELYEHIIRKTKNHPHFKVEETKGKESKPKSSKPAGEASKSDEDEEPTTYEVQMTGKATPIEDEEEENGGTDIPSNWRELHHKRIIAIARRLGGDGDALATRDGAIQYIEEQLALGTLVSPEPFGG